MLKAKTPLLVGIVLIVGALAFVLTFGSLEQGMDLDGGVTVHAIFDDATGLVEKSRVKLSGIPVGQIEAIGLDPDDQSKARVTLKIMGSVVLHEGVLDPETGRWVNGATVMRLQASLLGDYYVSIAPGVAGPPIREGGEIHNVVTEAGLDAILKQVDRASAAIFPKLEKITDDISAVTGAVRETFGTEEGVSSMQQIRDNVARTSDEVAALSSEMRAFLKTDVYSQGARVATILENAAKITESLKGAAASAERRLDTILANVDGLTADLRMLVGAQGGSPSGGQVGGQGWGEAGGQGWGEAGSSASGGAVGSLRPGTVSSALAKLDRNMTVLEGTLENVHSVTTKIDRGQGTVGRLINDERLVDDIEAVVGDVRSLTSTISRLQVKMEFRGEYYFLQNSLKNYVSIRFQPQPDKYYLFELVSDPQGKRTYSQRVTTSNDPDKPPVVVEDVVKTESALKITLQLAKRWHFLTFRYGLMESGAGLGLDVNLLEDALRFKLDVFDFGADNFPRVRLLATYEFVRHLYVAVGIDDVLNNASRDYFVGLGVSFTDDDLKGLLPFLPTGAL